MTKPLATSYDFEKEEEIQPELMWEAKHIKRFAVIPQESFYTEDRERFEEQGE